MPNRPCASVQCFSNNDDRIEALISIVGLALVVFGLIEIELRSATGDERLEGLLPEGRAARPTSRNILAAFQGLGITYTQTGIVSTASPTPNAASSSCLPSHPHGPNRLNNRHQTAENGTSRGSPR
jgi:hypothetical protein